MRHKAMTINRNLKGSRADMDADLDYDDLLGLNTHVKHKRYNIKSPEIFYLYDEIGEVHDYIDMIHILIGAEEGDDIHIRISSCGGLVDTMIAILHAMGQCKGHITTHADSEIASAATMIFLAGDTPMIYPYSSFMFHTISGGYYGKIQENISRIGSIEKLVDRLAQDYLHPFFTDAELLDMKNGKDFYFDADEMVKRINNPPALNTKQKPKTKKAAKDV